MKIKINKRILSVPPHISTGWESVQSISKQDDILQIILMDGSTIEIPDLKPETIEKIFVTHAEFLEGDTLKSAKAALSKINPQQLAEMGDNIFQIGFGAVDELGTVMQHNENQSDAPDLPAYVTEKIAALAKAMAPEELTILPKAEPGCNCMHCQIARAILGELEDEVRHEELLDEDVTDADLHFDQWTITQTGENLFTVTNKLDDQEHYSVFLGSPVGCTCGQANCEHIVAVLKS